MSARRTAVQIAAKGFTLIGALFLVSVLLSAMPGHRAPVATPQDPQATPAPREIKDTVPSSMAGMDMSDEKASEGNAVHDMESGNMEAHSRHMHMTKMRQRTPDDIAKANDIVKELREGIEKYKDYQVALDEGYKIFLPNVPQPEYHFTNYGNGILEAFTFDAARPTSLLYKKTASGYELVGAMYTMPKRASEEQLNERVPLSVAMWHLHTNLCMPPRGQLRKTDWTKFGLRGSIATEDACDAAGGDFKPVVFGWMVHVYPYEDSLDKIFSMHHHMN
jgi:hypothetical protein